VAPHRTLGCARYGTLATDRRVERPKPTGPIDRTGGRASGTQSDLDGLTRQQPRSPSEYPPSHRNVHHDYSECRYGKDILLEDRVAGTGNKPLCDECIKHTS
jgi:hypothetical protein